MAIQFESSIEVVGSISATASAYVYSLYIGNQSGQISNKIWFNNGGSPYPGLYFEGGQPKFIIYSSVSNIFHDTYHPNADTWTTARTITIGNTGKSVNGSANVSWTLAEIGAQAALTNPVTGTGTTNYLPKFTGSTTLGNSLVYDNGTNVGIGTTNPSNKLSLAGSGQNWTTSPAIKMWDSFNSKGWYVGSANNNTAGDFYIRSVTTEGAYPVSADQQFTIKQSGNVGIGTISPGAKLEVLGQSGVIIDSGTSSNAVLTLKGDVSDYGGGGQINIIGGSQDYLYYATNIKRSPGTFEAKEEYEMLGHTWTWDGNMGGTANQPYTSFNFKSQGSSQMTIYNNNVGVGITNPSEKLHVVGNTSITNNLYVGQNNTLKSCTYSPTYSLVVGQSNVLGGIANGIVGVNNTIECTAEPWLSFGGNFIAGKDNKINNLYSHANAVFGQSNTVGAFDVSSNSVAGALVGGNGNTVNGDNSLAFGNSCFVDLNADMSLTGGFDSNNFGKFGSVAIGAGATASFGNNQYAFGTGVTTPTNGSAAYGADQFVVGKFNVYSTGGRVHRFAVGNGSSDGIRSNALNVDTFGRTGLGVTSPSYQLQLSSNSAAKPTSSSWTVVSDERVKTNIQDYTTGLTEILQINPKTFDYNGKAGFDTTTGNIGIIAQDVQGIMPETINTYEAKLNEDDAEETELFNFDSHPIQFALINAVKELNAKVEALEARIQTLEGN